MNKYFLPYLTAKEKQLLFRFLKTASLFTLVVLGAIFFNVAVDWMWGFHYGRAIILTVFVFILYTIFTMIYKSNIAKSAEEKEDAES